MCSVLCSTDRGGRSRKLTRLLPPPLDGIQSTGDSLKQLKLLSERYAERPGGYTRIHLHGNRKGDHAPRAILELVDGPRDLRLEITARAIARQTLHRSSGGAAHDLSDYANGKPYSAADFGSDLVLERFHPLTALNIRKATRFGGAPALAQLASKVNAAIVWQRAERAFEGGGERRPDAQRMQAWAENAPRGSELKGAVVTRPYMGKKSVAGEEHLGSTGTPASQRLVRRGQEVKHSVIRLGKGVFAKRPRNRRTAFVPPPLPGAGAAQRVSA